MSTSSRPWASTPRMPCVSHVPNILNFIHEPYPVIAQIVFYAYNHSSLSRNLFGLIPILPHQTSLIHPHNPDPYSNPHASSYKTNLTTRPTVTMTGLAVWNLLEVQIGIVAACGPTLRSILAHTLRPTTSSLKSLLSRLGGGSSSRSNNGDNNRQLRYNKDELPSFVKAPDGVSLSELHSPRFAQVTWERGGWSRAGVDGYKHEHHGEQFWFGDAEGCKDG